MAGSNSRRGGPASESGLPRCLPLDSASNYRAADFAALRTLPTQRLVDDQDWHDDDAQDFHRRFAVGHQYLPGEPRTVPRRSFAPSSNASSMAVTIDPSQYSSIYTPSLAGSCTTRSSRPSVSTGSGGSALDRYQRSQLLEEGDDGVFQVPTAAAIWQCPYRFLGCNVALDDIRDWDTHCQFHFRGTENLPRYVDCPFGCQWSYKFASGAEAWASFRNHVVRFHSTGGSVVPSARPNPGLIRHLWQIGAITSAQEKDLRRDGYISNNNIYLESGSSSRDRRQERRQDDRRNPYRSGSSSGYPVVRR